MTNLEIMSETFPRQQAATGRFSFGAPRSFQITKDGAYVTFLRSDHSRDSVNSMWVYSLADNIEHKIFDSHLVQLGTTELPAEELARRERMRETGSGITTYASDESGKVIVFAFAGELVTLNIESGKFAELEVTKPIIDPQISPDGLHVAWSTGKELRTCTIAGRDERALAVSDDKNVTWGLADFVSAEEFGRMHGYWWSPDSQSLLVQRVDNSPVATWWISDPVNPEQAPRQQKYPATGKANAKLSLLHFQLSGGTPNPIWESNEYEYLINVRWQQARPALVTLSNRAQTKQDTYALLDDSLALVHSVTDEKFIEVIPGQPRWINESLITIVDNYQTDTRELQLDGISLTPIGMQVLNVVTSDHESITVQISTDGVARDIVRVRLDGEVTYLTTGGVSGVSPAVETSLGALQIVMQSRLDNHERTYELTCAQKVIHAFDSQSESALVKPKVEFLKTGPNQVNTAVLFPSDHIMGSKKLPILARPYGGPHGARVIKGATNFNEDQWYADQGFAVVIADGRGTPARGPAWEKSIYQDFVGPILQDQVDSITGVAELFPDDVDPEQVAIMGWSFGGYLAGLAVLERPDVFHVAIAGAPVTEWLWYDTAYSERYLGHPDKSEGVYEHHSLMTRAANLSRPLMLVHGLIDDNVVIAHSLELSRALLAEAKDHTLLPLSGVTHMPHQPKIAENLMLMSVEFIKKNLKNS